MLATLSRAGALVALTGLLGHTDLVAQKPATSRTPASVSNARANPADVLRRQASDFQSLRTGPIADPRFHRATGRKQLVSDFRGAVRPGLRRAGSGTPTPSAGALIRLRQATRSAPRVRPPSSGGVASVRGSRPVSPRASPKPAAVSSPSVTAPIPKRRSLPSLLGQHGMVDRFGRPLARAFPPRQ